MTNQKYSLKPLTLRQWNTLLDAVRYYKEIAEANSLLQDDLEILETMLEECDRVAVANDGTILSPVCRARAEVDHG